MKKIELLAPAGDQESLIAAIQNGANAIYLGGTLFSARAYAKNFTNEQLEWAVSYAHLREVKVYVTVNTLFRDDELKKLIQYIDYLYQIQVDALIIQDIGLFHAVRKRYPDFEIHISTQASVMNSQAVKYFEKYGASRIVLARENTIEEIQTICQSTSLEIEVFIHGALCVCYSGQCLMSSFIGKRSGNRGSCAQPCRLSYHLCLNETPLENKVPFILSPKDLMTIQSIGELIDAGVTSFKVEGRMKKPEYVASVIKAYRHAIDAHIEQKQKDLQKDIKQMKAMFNRDYTSGYVFHDNNIVNGDYSGNKGSIIGKVIGYNKKKKHVLIHLNNALSQGDSIVLQKIDKGRPINKIFLHNRLVSDAQSGDIVEIEFDYPVYDGLVRKTVDSQIIKEMQQTYQKENCHLPIQMIFEGKINKSPQLTIQYQNYLIQKESKLIIEEANKTPLTKERIIQQLCKLGENPFYVENVKINIDHNISMPIKELNLLRRQGIEELSNLLAHRIIHNGAIKEIPLYQRIPYQKKPKMNVLVSQINQLYYIIDLDIDMIFYPFQKDIEKAYQICRDHHKEFALFIPRICKDKDLKAIKNHPIYSKIENVVVNEMGAYTAFCDKIRIIGTGFNIYNSWSAASFQEKKILSLEMSRNQIRGLQTDMSKCFVQVYGKVENMITEYCPISQYYYGYQRKNCQICKKGKYSLKDRKGELFDIMTDDQCRIHILNCRTLMIDNFHHLQIGGIFIHLTNEDGYLSEMIIKDFICCLKNQKEISIRNKLKTTSGYFKE